MNPITVLQKTVDGIKALRDLKAVWDGIRDELLTIFTDEEITVAQSLARGLEECHPYSDHVDELSLSVMSKAKKILNKSVLIGSLSGKVTRSLFDLGNNIFILLSIDSNIS